MIPVQKSTQNQSLFLETSLHQKRRDPCANWMTNTVLSIHQMIIGSINVNTKHMQCCTLLIAKHQAAIAKRNQGQLEPQLLHLMIVKQIRPPQMDLMVKGHILNQK